MPVGPSLSRLRFKQKDRPDNGRTCLLCELGILIGIVSQALMQSRIEPPGGNQHGVIAWIAGKIPETNISRGTDFHDGGQAAECQPASTHLLLHWTVAVAAGIRTPVGVAHDSRTLSGHDSRTQSFLGADDVACPKLSVG